MGREERAKQEAVRLGKFNVHIRIDYNIGAFVNGTFMGYKEEYDVKSWTDGGAKLALEMYDGTLRIVILENVKHYTVSQQDVEIQKAREGEMVS